MDACKGDPATLKAAWRERAGGSLDEDGTCFAHPDRFTGPTTCTNGSWGHMPGSIVHAMMFWATQCSTKSQSGKSVSVKGD